MIAKIILIGHVGKDPEIKTDKTTFSVAVKLSKEKTDWWNCLAYDKTAEIVQKFVRKGDLVYIEGQPSQWKNSEGESFTNVFVHQIRVLKSKQTEVAATSDDAPW